MYRNPMYKNDSADAMVELIRANPLGALVSAVADSAQATHLPCLVARQAGGLSLLTHLAKETFARLELSGGKPVMLIFRGADSYISPRWYREVDVPTWNYSAVHLWGTCQPLESDQTLRRLLHDTVDEFESAFQDPWNLNQVEESFLDQIQPGITGIKIEVESAQGVFKLSQERDRADQDSVISGLEQQSGGTARCPVAHDIARVNFDTSPT